MTGQEDIDTLLAEAESLANEAESELRSTEPAPSADAAPQPVVPAGHLPQEVQRVLKIGVPLIVRLAHKSMPVSQIINLAPGSIIEFDRSADEPLDLMTNNRCIGYGTAVKVGENFGVRVTSIIDARGKLEALTKK